MNDNMLELEHPTQNPLSMSEEPGDLIKYNAMRRSSPDV